MINFIEKYREFNFYFEKKLFRNTFFCYNKIKNKYEVWILSINKMPSYYEIIKQTN